MATSTTPQPYTADRPENSTTSVDANRYYYIVRVAAAAEWDHLTLLLLDRLDLLFGKAPSNRVVPGMSSKETLDHALTSDIEALRPAFTRTPPQAASALRLPQRSSTTSSDSALEQHGVN